MSAQMIVENLRARHVTITLNGDRLKIDAPLGALTDEDRQAIREHKAGILVLLLSDIDENIEMHDSALFDVVVEVDFYTGERHRIPQQSTPAGWRSPF